MLGVIVMVCKVIKKSIRRKLRLLLIEHQYPVIIQYIASAHAEVGY